MGAIQIFKPKSLHIIDIEKPFLTEKNNVLVCTTTASICGSDIDIYHNTGAAATCPRIIGHETVGVVEEAASSVTSLCPSGRVIVNQVISCGHCYPYRMGRGSVCGSLAIRGMCIDGGCQEYAAMPQEDCYLLPDSISGTDAVMAEPTTIAIRSCTRAELRKDDMLLIYRCDALESSILKITRLSCDYIIVAGVVDEKLEGAKSAGAAHAISVLKEGLEEKIKEYTHGHGATVSIDAVCGSNSLTRLLKATGNAGRVITMGFSTSPTEINQFLITSKELDVRDSRLQSRMFGRAIELISEGKLGLTGGVSHTFPLLKAQKAFGLVGPHDPSIRKVVLTFDF